MTREDVAMETMKTKNVWKQRFAGQEYEDSGHAVDRSWCAACVEGRGVGRQHRIELLEEEKRERNHSDCSFLTTVS